MSWRIYRISCPNIWLCCFCFGNKGWSWSASWNPSSCMGQRSFSSWMQGKVSYKHRMLDMVWMLLSLLSLPSTWTDLNETMDGQVCCFTYSSEIPQDIQGWDALQSRVLVSQKSKHFLTPKKYCEILSALPTSLPYPSNAKSTTSVGISHPFIEDLPLKIMEKLALMGTCPYIFLRVSSIFCRCSPLPN